MFAHRRVACTASRGCGSAQFDDATDEIDEDLEERDELSETIVSGEDLEEIKDAVLDDGDRRAGVENANVLIDDADGDDGAGGQRSQSWKLSNVDLAR